MRLSLVPCATLLVGFVAPSVASAQTPELPQPSPKARVEQRVGLTDVAIDYASPGVKGRKIWGALVPYDKPWRTGANAATKLTVSRDFTFGGKAVPAGTYALYTIPGAKTWTVALNASAENWGVYGLDEKKDVVRITVKPATAPMRERLAFVFSDTTDDSAKLDLEWEKVRVSIPLAVDTKTQALANIEKTLGDTWRPHMTSARWLLDNGGDLDNALSYIDQSIGIKATWWNNWVRAQILAKKGRAPDAVGAAEKAFELGKGDTVFEGSFKEEIAKAIGDWKRKS